MGGSDGGALARRFAPVVEQLRGRDLDVKRAVVARLTPTERAVFAWYSFHVHALADAGHDDDGAMFRRLSELYVNDWEAWDDVEAAAELVADPDFVELCRRVRSAAGRHGAPSPGKPVWSALAATYRELAPNLAARFADALS